MADNVAVTEGSGSAIAADELTDATLGLVKVQYVKIMDGTLDGSTKASVGANGLKVDGSGVTQPVSNASLPLPSGASTAAKQPALGTAGTPSADVLTVQGATSMTPLKVDASATTQPVSGTITANIGTAGSLALDASVSGLSISQGATTATQKGSILLGGALTTAAAVTTATAVPLSINAANGGVRVSLIATGVADVQGVSSNGDGSSNTRAMFYTDSRVSLFNGATWDRAVKPNATSKITTSAASVNATSAKASAGNIFSIQLYNTTATLTYLKIYNKASAPTVGTDTPVKVIPIPPNAAVTLDWAFGYYLSTGIAYGLTTDVADAGTTAVASGAIVGLNIDYS